MRLGGWGAHIVSNKRHSPDLSLRRVIPIVTYIDTIKISNKWAFQQWVLRPGMNMSSWRFRHLNIVGCFLKKKRLIKREEVTGTQFPPLLDTPLILLSSLFLMLCLKRSSVSYTSDVTEFPNGTEISRHSSGNQEN